MTKNMDRRKAREHAFTMIFQYKFRPSDAEEIIADFLEENDPANQRKYIEGAVRGTIENIDAIDKKISEYSKGWSVDRINAVSLAALRLGAYELLFCDDIPNPVAVNEAVNLTRKFAGPETVDFVNGILGNMK